MDRYRITFSDDAKMIIHAESLNQAIASAVRNDRWDREIVKVEKWVISHDERVELIQSCNK